MDESTRFRQLFTMAKQALLNRDGHDSFAQARERFCCTVGKSAKIVGTRETA